MNMEPTDLAYAAGIIDGEGCIFIDKQNPSPKGRGKTPRYAVRVAVAMCDPEVCEWLQERWPGFLTRVEMAKYNPKARPSFRWIIVAEKAVNFLEDVFPFLKIRHHQARIAIRYQKEYRRKSTPIKRGSRGRFAKGNGLQSEEQVAEKESLKSQISRLNQKG